MVAALPWPVGAAAACPCLAGFLCQLKRVESGNKDVPASGRRCSGRCDLGAGGSNWFQALPGGDLPSQLLASVPSAPSFCSPTLRRTKSHSLQFKRPASAFSRVKWRLTCFLPKGGSFQALVRAPRPCWAQVRALSLLTWWKQHQDVWQDHRDQEIKKKKTIMKTADRQWTVGFSVWLIWMRFYTPRSSRKRLLVSAHGGENSCDSARTSCGKRAALISTEQEPQIQTAF